MNGRQTEIRQFAFAFLKSHKNIVAIFDDYNSSFSKLGGNDLFPSHGLHFDEEVYYWIDQNSPFDLAEKCFRYSDATWHSLCILTREPVDDVVEGELTSDKIGKICAKSVAVVVCAYDAEAYVFWERSD